MKYKRMGPGFSSRTHGNHFVSLTVIMISAMVAELTNAVRIVSIAERCSMMNGFASRKYRPMMISNTSTISVFIMPDNSVNNCWCSASNRPVSQMLVFVRATASTCVQSVLSFVIVFPMFTISVYRVIRYRDHITTAGNCNNNHEHFIMCDWRQPITQSATYHNNNREHFILGGYHIPTVNYNNNREHFILGGYHDCRHITTTIDGILFCVSHVDCCEFHVAIRSGYGMMVMLNVG